MTQRVSREPGRVRAEARGGASAAGRRVLATAAAAACLLAAVHVVFAGGVALRWPFAPRRPSEETRPFTSREATAGDGVRLHAWLFPAIHPRGAALLLHGYHGSGAQMAGLADRLRDGGLDVLAPDFRAHGASEGWRISFGDRERRDVRAWLQVFERALGHPPRDIVVVGLSMGAAAAVFDANDVRGCAGVVLLAPFRSLEQAVDRRFRILAGIPARPLGDTLLAFTSWVAGCEPAALRPIDHVARIAPAPVFLIGGLEDRRVPPEVLRAFEARAREPKELLLLEGFDHFALAAFDRPALTEPILAFARRCLGERR